MACLRASLPHPLGPTASPGTERWESFLYPPCIPLLQSRSPLHPRYISGHPPHTPSMSPCTLSVPPAHSQHHLLSSPHSCPYPLHVFRQPPHTSSITPGTPICIPPTSHWAPLSPSVSPCIPLASSRYPPLTLPTSPRYPTTHPLQSPPHPTVASHMHNPAQPCNPGHPLHPQTLLRGYQKLMTCQQTGLLRDRQQNPLFSVSSIQLTHWVMVNLTLVCKPDKQTAGPQ